MQVERDEEFERGILTRKLEAGEDVLLQSERAAVLRNVTNPKAEYHYVVMPKEDIVNVTALSREHLPLLDHMMQLSNQIIEKQHLPSSNFRIGFKINAFMNRLNMHVISDDFCSESMRRIHHWNNFNTDLFITFQAVYALLNTSGCVEPISADMADKLKNTSPVRCNQCTFMTSNFPKFKDHLLWHWQKRESTRHHKMGVSNLSLRMCNMNLNGNSIMHGMASIMQFPNNCRPNMGPHQYRPTVNMQNVHSSSSVGPSTSCNLATNSQQLRFNNPLSYKQKPFKQVSHSSQQPKANEIQKSVNEVCGTEASNVISNKNEQAQQQLSDNVDQVEDQTQRQPNAQPFKKKWYNKKKKKTQLPASQASSDNTKEARDA